VAERGAKAAELKAEFDVRYAVAARLKLEIEAVDAEERDVQQAEADNALAKAKVEAAENDVKEWRKRRVQVAAANEAARRNLEIEEAFETATARSRALAVELAEAQRDVDRLKACQEPEELVMLLDTSLHSVETASRPEALNVQTGLAVGVAQLGTSRLLSNIPTLEAPDRSYRSAADGESWNPFLEKPWGSETRDDLELLAQEITALAPTPHLPKSLSNGLIPADHSVQSSYVLNALEGCCPGAARLLDGTALAIAQLASDTATALTTSLRVPVGVRRALRNRLAAGGRGPILGAVGEAFLMAATGQITALERAAVGGLLVGQDKLTPMVRALVVGHARDGGLDTLSDIYRAMRLQVRARPPERQFAREAILRATSYQPSKSATLGSFGGAIQNRRQLLQAAEAAAAVAGETTGLALDSAKRWFDFAKSQLTDQDSDGKQVLSTLHTDVLMGRLDEADGVAVEREIDKLVVAVEAERATRLADRTLADGATIGATDKATAEAKAKAAKAKAEAEARATSAAVAAAVVSSAATVLRGNLAQQTFPGTCFRCGKTGHKQVDCPVPAPKP
jgi:hypothetical protein